MPRSVLITGVSSGIGLGLLRASLDRGDLVFALGRRPPPDSAGLPNLRFAPCDLADFASIPSALDGLLQGVSAVDLAVLNAGVLGRIGDLRDVPLEELKQVMDVNLWANKALVDALLAGPREVGQIVAISSGAAVSGARGWNAYALSKAALNMLMKLYAAEAPEVHFSALAPGLVDTGMQSYVRTLPGDARFPVVERLKASHGTQAMPSPEEAAPRLLEAMKKIRRMASGGFHDIRSLE
jgi:NAD(P)-dependent dehydrogenase (short-subunit alcohol dehydrogenase family)